MDTFFLYKEARKTGKQRASPANDAGQTRQLHAEEPKQIQTYCPAQNSTPDGSMIHIRSDTVNWTEENVRKWTPLHRKRLSKQNTKNTSTKNK